jgi:hypothetical protein
MKAVINGKRYDTETAKLIGEADNLGQGVDSVTDFGFWEAGLYVTKNGNYFLAGEGGAASMFSQPVGSNARGGGSGIKPLSKDQALEWAERYLDAGTVEQWFGDDIEDA